MRSRLTSVRVGSTWCQLAPPDRYQYPLTDERTRLLASSRWVRWPLEARYAQVAPGGDQLLTRDVRAAARLVAAAARTEYARDAGAAGLCRAFGQPTAGGTTAGFFVAVKADRAHALAAREAGLVRAIRSGRRNLGASCSVGVRCRIGGASLRGLVSVVCALCWTLRAATASRGDGPGAQADDSRRAAPRKPAKNTYFVRGAYTFRSTRVTSES